MPNKGLLYPPLGIIQNLRNTLRSGYDSESIPRELLQNADDAGANCLHFGWTPGLTSGDTSNPLLQDPALFAVNDGPFNDENARAIRLVGISSKSGDGGTIGKFGLGLKSVFCVCEAFYYIAGEDSLQPRIHDVVNPWSDTGLPGVETWDRFDLAEARAVVGKLGPALRGLRRYFILWMPLRVRGRLSGRDPIYGECFDDSTRPPDSIFEELGQRFASFLPLLHSVRSVKGWGLGSAPYERFAVSFREDDRRCPRPTEMAEGGRATAKGTMLMANGDSAGCMVPYVALTADLNKETSDLRTLAHLWPTTTRTRGGEEEAVPEDNPAHAGVCWQRWPAPTQGRLRWRWAAFLPLRQSRSLPLAGEQAEFEYLLTLHAAGFVNPGRTDFLDGEYRTPPEDPEQLYRAWNQTLRHRGTLPLLPESLLIFRDQASLTDAAVQLLVRAVASEEFLRPPGFREAVCSRHQLVYHWTPTDGPHWATVSSSAALFEIPDPDGQDAADAVPLLKELSGQRGPYFVLENWPRIARAGAAWATDLLCQALDGAGAGADGLGYLARFVRLTVGTDSPTEVIDSLARLARRILLAEGAAAGREPHLAEIAGRLPPERVLCLPLPGTPDGFCPFLRSLLKADASWRLLPLPESLRLFGRAQPNTPDAAALLEAIDEGHSSGPAGLRSEIALAVLGACSTAVVPEVLNRCGRLRLFLGHEVKDGATRERAFAVTDLREARESGTLFTDDMPSLADALSLATGSRILLAPRDVAVLAGPSPGPCSATACASLLSRWDGPDLRGPDARSPLLATLSSHAPSCAAGPSENRLAVRLLLHGRSGHLRSEEPLLYDRHGAGLWDRIVRAVLGQGDQWRLIDPALAARVPPHRAKEYSLEEVTPQATEEELRRLGPERLSRVRFDLTTQDARELLRCIQDVDVLRALPIHEDAVAVGTLRRIGPGCYWEKGVDLPQGLPAPPVLLRRSTNVAERAIQDTLRCSIGHPDAIRILLNQPEPHRYWRPILDSFYSLGRAVSHEVLGALRSPSWLPGPNGPVAPASILHLPGLADALASIPLDLLQGTVPSSRLLEAGEHKGLQSLADHGLVPSQEEALGLLGEALAQDARYHVGQSSAFLNDDAQGHADLNSFLQAFAGVPEDAMATYPLATAVERTCGWGVCVRAFLGPLKKPLPQDRVLRILDFLRQRHEQDGPREHVERAYLWYLKMVDGPEKRTFPDGLRLLSRAGTWRTADQLCVGSDAINREWRIDERQLGRLLPSHGASSPPDPAQLLSSVPPVPQGAALDRELDGSVKRLGAYFAEWERARPHLRPAMGGFLAALGDGPGGTVRQLAERLLLPACELEDLRERMRQCGIRGESPPTRFNTRRVLVEVIDTPTVPVTNLCGGQVEVPLVQLVESLLLPFGDGNFETTNASEDGRQVQVTRLRLRRVDPEALADRLGELLREATRQVLIHFYWLFPERDVFAPLIHADSQQLRAAQNLILDNAPLYLGQLGVGERGALAEAIRRMHLARNLAAQEEVAADHLEPGSKAPPPLAPERRRQARAALQAQLHEPGTQMAILAAIRRKVSKDFAYVPSSVPFEILQNADDATVESHDADRSWLGVWAGQGRVAFLHEGRAINQPPVGQPYDALLGHERDLEKMLVLLSSDKPASEQGLTGKFGLGFKSVFLVCDEPLARSGGLGFRVLGGIYPQALAANEARALEDRFAQVAGCPLAERNGTIIELPLRDGAAVTFLDEFLDLLPLALAFTRRVRRCTVRVQREQEVRWEAPEPVPEVRWEAPEPVPGVEGVAAGLLDGSRLFARQRALVFDLGERRMLLIGLNPNGLCRLHDDLPTIWVTAPTRVKCRVGFALNAPFDLDVGRTQLQREEAHHHSLADELGAELGRRLVALHDAPWENVRQALGLRAELTREKFWESVWARFGAELHARRRESDDLALRLLQRALYGQEGLRRLYTGRRALPTGLPGERFGGLTVLDDVKHYLTGCLDEGLGLLARVEQWPALARRVRGGELVSRVRIWEPLLELLPRGPHRADPLDLARIMEWELEADRLVTPERACLFGALITKKFTDALEGNEGRRLREALRVAKFIHAGRGDAEPSRLLVGQGAEEEEQRRAAFAPPEWRLAPEYQGVALDFFLACRHGMPPRDDQQMAEWLLNATTEQKRRGALDYLLRGNRREQVRIILTGDGLASSWMADLRALPWFGDYPEQDQLMLLVLLSQLWIKPQVSPLPPEPTPRPPAPDPEAAVRDYLQRVEEWWTGHAVPETRRFHELTYPHGEAPRLSANALGDPDQRRQWLVLFLVGMTHTVGRAKWEHHRSFISLCDRRGWLHLLAQPDPDLDGWFARVRQYIDSKTNDILYYSWLRLSAGIVTLARHLDAYVTAFLQADRFPRDFALTHVTVPRASDLLRNTDTDAPPLAPILGMGACFVMRELVRLGTITNRHAYPHCYEPCQKLRTRLERLGLPLADAGKRQSWSLSSDIYRFLCRHHPADPTFGLAFDLPLLLYPEDPPDLRVRHGEDGKFVTLGPGWVIPRSYMR